MVQKPGTRAQGQRKILYLHRREQSDKQHDQFPGEGKHF